MFIRKAVVEDAADLARIYAPWVERSVVSFESVAPDAAEMSRRMQLYQPWLVALLDEQIVGYAYASPHHGRAAYRWSVDSTVYLDERVHRRGVGRRLYNVLLALLRAQGIRAVHASITLPNPASVGLHEAFGFVPIGVYPKVGFKDGRWLDVGIWQLELAPRTSPPEEPRALTEAAWRAALLQAQDVAHVVKPG